MRSKNLKPLSELEFETIGDEFIFLYKTLYSKNKKDDKITPNIEVLRQEYNLLVNKEDIDNKYSKTSIYWSEEQEKAIIDYINEKNHQKRNIIFKNHLYKPFKKLIENIIFTYKLFRNDVDVFELQSDCMSFLITKINKFNPKSGTKSFAYFGTIAKHYLMGEKKTLYKANKNTIEIEQGEEEVNGSVVEELKDFAEECSTIKLFNKVIKALELEIKNPKTLSNDKKVGEAIIWVFQNHEVLNVYNKNLVYHLLKERTNLQTKEITYSLSRLKSFYKVFKEGFLKKNI